MSTHLPGFQYFSRFCLILYWPNLPPAVRGLMSGVEKGTGSQETGAI